MWLGFKIGVLQDTSTLTISANKTVVDEDAATDDKKDEQKSPKTTEAPSESQSSKKEMKWHRTERMFGSISR